MEMNTHTPQSIQTMFELMDFTAIPYHILGPKDGKPVIGIVQDTLLGMYRLTKNNVRISDKVMANLQMVNSYFDGTLPANVGEDGSFSGRDAYSMIVPPGLYFSATNGQGKKVVIENGKLKEGMFDKGIYNKGLTSVVFHDYGPFETRRFLDDTQRLACRWLMTSGFSVGISDLVIDPNVKEKLVDDINTMKQNAYKKISDVRNGKLDNLSIYSNHEYFEIQLGGILNQATKAGQTVLDTINDDTNRMLNMVKSGSKGSDINVSQMVACLGQQFVDSRRIPYGFTDRTLPHFTKYDDGPDARGFVESNFIGGLTPQETFFHAMGGREGLIDTAVKSITGDTTIVIIEDGAPKLVKIGEWIDQHMAQHESSVTHYPSDRNMELLTLPSTVYIPSSNNDGKVTWEKMTAITRHDPSETVYEVTTRGGRKVTVADSQTLLIWNSENNKFEPVESKSVKIGDFVPVTASLAEPTGHCAVNDQELVGLVTVSDETIVNRLREYFAQLSYSTTLTSIQSGETTYEEASVVALLLSRLGIYAEIVDSSLDVVRVAIRGEWAHKFAEIVETALPPLDASDQYRTANDVVLDAIVSINVKDASSYKKLYDVTVPTTTNFSISNGLTVYDTSDTGYLQRRLVKAMEDCKIYYDNTVRNATGSIVQFLYGEDGMEGTKVEGQKLPYIRKTTLEIEKMYLVRKEDNLKLRLTPDAFASLEAGWDVRCREYFDQVLEDREFIITKVFKNEVNDSISFPIPFARIVNIAATRVVEGGLNKLPTALTPDYIIRAIAKLEERLFVSTRKEKLPFLGILCRAFLSPKMMIFVHQMSAAAFDWICTEAERYFKEAVAHPGEMVGIIAAQSIGEYSTQLTLNSVEYDTKMLLRVNGTLKTVRMGEYIEGCIAKMADDDIENHPNDTKLGWLRNDKVEVLATTEDGEVIWDTVQAVTRHPVVNKDGSNTLLKVTLRSGRSVTATKAKSFLQRFGNKIDLVEGDKLEVGQFLPVSRVLPTLSTLESLSITSEKRIIMDADFGQFVAAYMVNGKCTRHIVTIREVDNSIRGRLSEFCQSYGFKFVQDECSIVIISSALAQLLSRLIGSTTSEKQFPAEFLDTPYAFIKGVIDGCFSTTKRTVVGSQDVLEGIQQVLVKYGMTSSINKLNDNWTLTVDESTADDIIPQLELSTGLMINTHRRFVPDLLKTATDADAEVIKRLLAEGVRYDEIVSIEEVVSPHPYVYDFTVEKTHRFNTYTGIANYDTFHLSGTASASKATRGVPRLKELLSVSKNIKSPTLIIYMLPEIAANKERSTEVLNKLELCRLNNILDYTEIFWDPAGQSGFDTGLMDDNDMLAIYRAFAEAQPIRCRVTSPWVLRMELNREKMHRVGVTMLDVYMKIFNTYGNQLECMFADDNTKNLIFRIRLTDMNKDIDSEDAVAALKAIEFNVVHHMTLKGMSGINKVSMREVKLERYDALTKAFKIQAEWMLDTDGTNLLDMLADKSVDPTRTISNDVWEIYHVLGIEAARQSLYMEIMEVVKESSINYRHIGMLIDTITSRGSLMPIDRHGINRAADVGPLAKTSFEESLDILINASMFSDFDRINGVSANIMLGQLPPCGTGDSEILLDEEKYIAMLKEMKHAKRSKGLESVDEAAAAEMYDPCSSSVIGFTYNLPPPLKDGVKLHTPSIIWT